MRKFLALLLIAFICSGIASSAIVKKYRFKCVEDDTNYYMWAESVDDLQCPINPAHTIDSNTIVVVEVQGDAANVKVIEQQLATTTDRLKWKGYMFTAAANDITTYDFTMPYDAHIQGGYFYAGSSKDGDMIELMVLPDTPYEYKYVESLYIVQGGEYEIKEEFSMSELLPTGTPLSVEYTNTDSQAKIITFVLILQIPQE